LRGNINGLKLTRLIHKTAIQLHVVAESCTICSGQSGYFWITLVQSPSYLTWLPVLQCSYWRQQINSEASDLLALTWENRRSVI